MIWLCFWVSNVDADDRIIEMGNNRKYLRCEKTTDGWSPKEKQLTSCMLAARLGDTRPRMGKEGARGGVKSLLT